MKQAKKSNYLELILNASLIVSVAVGACLFAISFSQKLSPGESGVAASLAGVIPMTAILIQRAILFLASKKREQVIQHDL